MQTKNTDKTASASQNMRTTNEIKQRLEYFRDELRAERISYGDLHELQSLAAHIDAGDMELLEAAGVPETATAAPETPTIAETWAACEAAERKLKQSQQPQHSPLPWFTMANPRPDELHQMVSIWCGTETRESIVCNSCNPTDAKLIVASVNHADKLAEALREIAPKEGHLPPPAMVRIIAAQALAAYEEAK